MPPIKKEAAPRSPEAPRDLAAWQRMMHTAITRPLAPGDRAQRRWIDGRPTSRVLAKLVKPSRTLRPIERVEIYNRMYWFRLFDNLAQDFPGLRALLGEGRFWPLAERYLADCPSRSYTLRNLGSRLPPYLARHPALAGPDPEAARDMARFEWAQIVAFDGPSRPRLPRRALAAADPGSLRLGLQPYVTVLRSRYPIDEYVLALKRDGALRGEASNAVTDKPGRAAEAPPLLRGPVVHVAVHRLDNQLYYKRLDAEAARLLRALRAGRTVADACADAFASSALPGDAQAEQVRRWFSLWMRLGWLCARE